MVLKSINVFLFVLVLNIICISILHSQYIDTDTSDVVIRKISTLKPEVFNVSDVGVGKDVLNNVHIVKVDIDIPVTTTFRVNVKDSAGVVIMYLINERTMKSGIYRVKWEMENCRTSNCAFPPGRYLCSFETDQFIYQKDFFLE